MSRESSFCTARSCKPETHQRRLRAVLTALSVLALLTSCDSREPTVPLAEPVVPSTLSAEAIISATERSWRVSRQQLQQALESAQQLQAGIQALVANANEDQLEQARSLWHQCHNQLLQALPLLTLGAVSPDLWQAMQEAHQQLEAWPIEPGYLDYFDVYRHSGIVNDIAIPVDTQALRQQHGLTSDTDVSLGMHAMAYLLWGELGQRPASDFQPQPLTDEQRQNGLQPVDLPNRRRATMLQLQATLLVDDMQQLLSRLSTSHGDLHSLYEKLPPISNLSLWRTSLRQLLQPLTEPVTATDEQQPHNQFAGQIDQADAALLRGIEEILFSQDPGQQPLAYWLVSSQQQTAEQLTALQQSLKQTIAQLEAGNADRQAIQVDLLQLLTALSIGDQRGSLPATNLAGN